MKPKVLGSIPAGHPKVDIYTDVSYTKISGNNRRLSQAVPRPRPKHDR